MKMIKDPITGHEHSENADEDLVCLSADTRNKIERVRALELKYKDILDSTDDDEETNRRWSDYLRKRSEIEPVIYNCLVVDLKLDEPAQD